MLQGWRLIIAVLLILTLALVLQAGLVAFIGYVFLGVHLLSRFLAREWIEQVTAERAFDVRHREIGESAEIVIRISNQSRFPIAWILVEELLPNIYLYQNPRKLTVKGSRIRVLFLRANQSKSMKYRLTFIGRGYFPVGPALAETGDVFGLYRRHRCLVEPAYVMVYPKVLPIETYDFASRRPIGEVRLANRLYEDPTRTAGVRPYQLGDPLQRLHWKATARTGILHSRVYEPTSLIGATIIIDFHKSSYPHRADIDRSELAITTASSLAYLISTHNQQLGLVSNGRDAADRIRDEALLRRDKSQSSHQNYESRFDARHQYELQADTDRLRPVIIETRRSVDQFQVIREALARLELTDGLTASQLMIEVAPRLPRDATVICLLGAVSVETAVALGNLRKQGFAVSIILIGLVDDEVRAIAAGRLIAEGLQDVRSVNNESEVTTVGDRAAGGPPPEYQFAVELV